jgi:hypothetical protein
MNAPAKSLTASIDLGLLNVMLAEVVSTAALRVHLQASKLSTDNESVASWSAPVANLAGGSIQQRFRVPESSEYDMTWQLNNLNSDPKTPILTFGSSGGVPALTAVLNFVVPGRLKGTGNAPDIPIKEFSVTITVYVTGEYTVVADVSAYLDINLGVTHVHYDVSQDVKTDVQQAISSAITEPPPTGLGLTAPKITSAFDSFFVSLLRLSGFVPHGGGIVASELAPVYADGHIQQYAIQGNSLVVTYYQVPRLVEVETLVKSN